MTSWLRQNKFSGVAIVFLLVIFSLIFAGYSDSRNVEAANYTRLNSDWSAGELIPRYFASFKLPIITGTANESVGDWLPDIAKVATIRVEQSGNWSSVLAGANLNTNDIVLIPEGVEVVYDLNSNPSFKAIAVKGELIFDPNKNTQLTVDTIHVYVTGALKISPQNSDIKTEIVFKGKINTGEDPEQFNLGLVATGGLVQINGANKETPVTQVVEAKAGSSVITVEQNTGWKVGDELYLSDDQTNINITTPNYRHTDQTEQVFITGLNGTLVTLNKALAFDHNSYITNVSRNVVLRSDVENGDRGHILASGHAHVTINNTLLKNLGRTTVEPLDDTIVSGATISHVGTNQNGRHVLHVRFLQNSFLFKGNTIVGAERIGILNHKGSGIISNNIVIGAKGAGIATATGAETGLIVGNTILGRGKGVGSIGKGSVPARSDSNRFKDSQGEDIASDGFGIWLRGPLTKVESNLVVGYFPQSAYAYFTSPDYADNIIPNIEGVNLDMRGKQIGVDSTPIQSYGSFNNNKADGLFGAGLYLENRQALNGDNITNLNIRNLAIDAGGIKTINSNLINLENIILTGAGVDGSGVGVLSLDNSQTKINIKNGRVENFALGYETPALGGDLEAVVFDNKIDIDVKDRPGALALVLSGVKFTNTSRDNIRFSKALGAEKTVYAYNYNQTGKNYRIYSDLDDVPETAKILAGLKNGLAEDLDGGDPEPFGNILVTNVTSDGLTVSWEAVTGATNYKIFIASEPSHLAIPPKRKEVATVSADILTYRIQNLSANTDIFIRVEAVSNNKFYQVYAKTKGGQLAELAGPMKSVHLYAPDVLMLVMEDKKVQSFSSNVGQLIGFTGDVWQNGPWVVKRNDGSIIPVSDIYRESVPTGHFYDTITQAGKVTRNADDLLDVESRIFIKLAEEVGNNEILDVAGPDNYNVIIPFSDKYLETPVVQLNQVGYSPRATRRYAYISGWMGDGGGLTLNNFPTKANVLVDSEDGLVEKVVAVSNIPIVLRSTNDVEVGGPVKEVNLSTVPTNDNVYYRIQVPGVGVSYRTMISELAPLKAFYVTARGLFLNRWGRDLDCQYTDWCDRPQDHPIVYEAEKSCNGLPCEGMFPGEGATAPAGHLPQTIPPTNKPRSLVGGHHDAGDYDIRKFHYLVARDLLRAYELNSSAFKDNQLNIPESRNGIPDLLDEILWSLAAWEQLQEDNGGVRTGVESYGHPPLSYADIDTFPYWTFSIDPYHTLRVAGLFAQTSRVLAPFHNQKATELKQRAIRAYNYAIARGIDHTLGGPIVYASSELYRLTGEEKYKTMFEAAWLFAAGGRQGYIPDFRNSIYWAQAWDLNERQPLMFDYVQGYLGSSGVDNVLKQGSITLFNNRAKTTISKIESGSAHRSARVPGSATTWGAATAINRYTQDIEASMQLGGISSTDRQTYFDTLSLMSDYVLGANPMGMSWVTGLGSKSPVNILWGDSIAFMLLENLPPMPGIPVFGVGDIGWANYYRYGRNATYPNFESRPTLRKYADVRTFIQNNEFTINETQSIITKLFAILVAPDSYVPPSWQPGESNHKNTLPTGGEVINIDTTPPSVPSWVSAFSPDERTVELNWSASIDPESDILYYRIYKNGQFTTTSDSTKYTESNLEQDTIYSYHVTAVNSMLLESGPNGTRTVKTLVDETGPVLETVKTSVDGRKLILTFDEAVDPAHISKDKFVISPAISVSAASIGDNNKIIELTTSIQQSSDTMIVTTDGIYNEYQISFNGIVDAFGNLSNGQKTYQYIWDAFLLWGDKKLATSFSVGKLVQGNAFRGDESFEGSPTPWHRPGIRLGGNAYRADVSDYDEIIFWAKASENNKTFNLRFGSWDSTTNNLNIDQYIEGGKLSKTYNRITVPIVDFTGGTDALWTRVQDVAFGEALPNAGHKIYIDEIWAVKNYNLEPVAVGTDLGTKQNENRKKNLTGNVFYSISNSMEEIVLKIWSTIRTSIVKII